MSDRAIITRIQERLAHLDLSERAASEKTGRGADVIRNMRRAIESGKPYNFRSDTVSVLASVLETTPDWLLTGNLLPSEPRAMPQTNSEQSKTRLVDLDHLRRVAYILFRHCQSDQDHAEDLAEVVVEVFAAEPYDSLDGDALQSFRVRLEELERKFSPAQ